MARFSRVFSVFSVLSVALFVSMCGPKPPAAGYSENMPKEIKDLIAKKYSQSICALGIATGPTEAIAIDKATMDARAEVARQFKVTVQALEKKYDESVNNKAIEEYKQVKETFVNTELNGTVVAKSLVRPEANGTISAKVLVVLSADQLKAIMDEKMQAYTSFKASKAYEELEARVAKEDAANAAHSEADQSVK
jgi:hypothetical protein